MSAGHAYIHALRNATAERKGNLEVWAFCDTSRDTYLAEQVRHSKVATNHHSDIGSPVLVYDGWSRGLHSEVLSQDGEDKALSPLVLRDERGFAYFIPTMAELATALETTSSDDPQVIAHVLNLSEVDAEIARRVNWCNSDRFNPGWYGAQEQITEADYIALRTAAHSTDEEYAFALLQANLPVATIVELCAIPPMPLEYAIAMVGGAI